MKINQHSILVIHPLLQVKSTYANGPNLDMVYLKNTDTLAMNDIPCIIMTNLAKWCLTIAPIKPS